MFRVYLGLKNCLVFFQMMVKHWGFFGTGGILSFKKLIVLQEKHSICESLCLVK